MIHLHRIGTVTRTLAMAVVLCITLTACIVEARPYRGAVIAVAPPAPRVEVYGAPPYPGYIWLGGYWHWTGARHEWVPGHWAAPRAGYRWVDHRWVHGPEGWHFEEGHWARR